MQKSEKAIIHPRALLLARKHQIPLEIKSVIPNEHTTVVADEEQLSTYSNNL